MKNCYLFEGRRRPEQEREGEGEGAAESVQAAARDEAASEADADALRLRPDLHVLHQSADRGKLWSFSYLLLNFEAITPTGLGSGPFLAHYKWALEI